MYIFAEDYFRIFLQLKYILTRTGESIGNPKGIFIRAHRDFRGIR